MDVDASSTSKGEVTPEQEADTESNIAKGCNPEPQPKEKPGHESEKRLSSCSVTARWRERIAQYQALEQTMQQWCQQDSPAIEDVVIPAHSDASCRAMCKRIARLKASCESFDASKDEYSEEAYSAAEKELVDAEKELIDAEKAGIRRG